MTPASNTRMALVCAGLAAAVALLFVLSIFVGRGGEWLPATRDLDPGVTEIILYQVRLPRALLGLMAGAALALGLLAGLHAHVCPE